MINIIFSTFKDDFNAFLKENGIFLAIGLVVSIIFVIVIIVLNKKK